MTGIREKPRSDKRRRSGTAHPRMLLPSLMFTALSVSVISTLGAPMVPTIAHEQRVSLSTAQWVLTSTLLAGAIAGPVLGRLGDGPRRRGAIQGALVGVFIGSVLAAIAPAFGLLLAGRALQGLGMGLMPLAIAVARDHLPAERMRSGISSLSITTSVGAGLGYPVTGVIAQHLDYRAGFWFAALLSAVALLVVTWVVPVGSSVPRRPLDVTGAVLLCSGLAMVLLALSQGVAWGLTSDATLGCLGAGVVVLAAWIVQALRTRHPLVDIRLIRNRAVLAANTTALLMGIGMYGVLSLINLYTQVPAGAGYGFHLSLTATGLVLMPMSLGSITANRLASALVSRIGLYRVLPLGALVVCVDLVSLALWRDHLSVLVLGTFLLGNGVGAAYAVMPLLIVRHVPPSETGSATSFNQVLRTIGGSVGSAAISAIMLAYTPAAGGTPQGSAYTTALLVTAAASFLGVIAAVVLPPRHGTAPESALGVVARGPGGETRSTHAGGVSSTAAPGGHGTRTGKDG
ncbi:MFS transporter [Streptomyces violaceusniger]|uniref:Major facilitator superfamily MFS_1 n=1 Tax=Streptomyces violaceusniger (strain Tu 4113) TaxID=653045 RepID=G2PF48_STRV4|nr:MFS transporter [Streptomyces violaceusniger]AEM84054.1 major facilitator superfamily MFS_1 [Streptomyces violaceusniger Tu 4113]